VKPGTGELVRRRVGRCSRLLALKCCMRYKKNKKESYTIALEAKIYDMSHDLGFAVELSQARFLATVLEKRVVKEKIADV
jgi:hypothetical protein